MHMLRKFKMQHATLGHANHIITIANASFSSAIAAAPPGLAAATALASGLWWRRRLRDVGGVSEAAAAQVLRLHRPGQEAHPRPCSSHFPEILHSPAESSLHLRSVHAHHSRRHRRLTAACRGCRRNLPFFHCHPCLRKRTWKEQEQCYGWIVLLEFAHWHSAGTLAGRGTSSEICSVPKPSSSRCFHSWVCIICKIVFQSNRPSLEGK